MEDRDWSIRYLIVETTKWWPGKSVLISPRSVGTIEWADSAVLLTVDREKVKGSAAYAGPTKVDRAYTQKIETITPT